MTYYVSSGTLNHTHSLTHLMNATQNNLTALTHTSHAFLMLENEQIQFQFNVLLF